MECPLLAADRVDEDTEVFNRLFQFFNPLPQRFDLLIHSLAGAIIFINRGFKVIEFVELIQAGQDGPANGFVLKGSVNRLARITAFLW